MKKKLSIFLVLVGLVFSIFSFSTNSFAIENDKSYEDDQVVSVTNAAENNQVISDSDSLHDLYYLVKDDISHEADQTISVSEDNSVSPLGFYLYKDKTIVVSYPNFGDITETYYYKEYSGGYWYSGYLSFMSSVKTSNGYSVTYSGKLSSWVE